MQRLGRPTLLRVMLGAGLALCLSRVNGDIRSGEDLGREARALRSAVEDLVAEHGRRYPQGASYLRRLSEMAPQLRRGDPTAAQALIDLRREALLANPLLAEGQILVVKRRPRGFKPSSKDLKIWFSNSAGLELGFPSNHECNSSLPREGYDNEIAVLDSLTGTGVLRTLFRPDDGGYVGEIDLHWQADRLLFTKSDSTHWKVFEWTLGTSELRQVSHLPDDVDAFDACYLPDGRIIFGSTASFQSVPCWHGQKRVSNLYLMNADGTGVRQLCFDQDHDLHPTILPNGQVMYHRWDYTGINHIFLRQLMVMNPDGTGQRAVYGANSWFPNALYFPQALPDGAGRVTAILSGYHGVHKMGQLVVIDPQHGWREADGIVQRLSGRFQAVEPRVADVLVNQDWPKFLHPFPISDRHLLVSGWMGPEAGWAVFLADVFDNVVQVHKEPDWALLEPVLLAPRPRPPVIPDRVDLQRKDGVVYIHDVYAGPGLDGVPRGVVKRLRVLAYDFGYLGLAGPDKIGLGGPWEVMQILGTVPIEADGSAMFRVPANTPLALQPLDSEGKAVQLMRSWMTLMPGETASCVGCHERPSEIAPLRIALAAKRPAGEIQPWYGPARGFDFAREVQPVLNRHCVNCHDGADAATPLDLRPASQVPGYVGRQISQMGIDRLDEKMRADTGGTLRYTPAYEALLPNIRRVGIEDDVSLLTPGEYHADTSPLIQMLAKGHGGSALTREDWDRLVTWIDLNAPCHGEWSSVYPVPNGADHRRSAMRRRQISIGRLQVADGESQVGETQIDPPAPALKPVVHNQPSAIHDQQPSWAFSPAQARQMQQALGHWQRTVELKNGLTLQLVKIPAGEFLMGDPGGDPDELPVAPVRIDRPFWLAATEISNQQFQQFKPNHQAGYYTRRHARTDDRGLPLDLPDQPAVRVSWEEAMAFCNWLNQRTGERFSLPTEAQWEWACRAGNSLAHPASAPDQDWGTLANLADLSFSRGLMKDHKQITGGLEHLVLEGADLSDTSWNDQAVVTAPVGRYQPNPWGLHDLIGNAAEWTRSRYESYPYRITQERKGNARVWDRRVVRGGSFFDPFRRARHGIRWAYPVWQRVFNVGFRVMCEADAPPPRPEVAMQP